VTGDPTEQPPQVPEFHAVPPPRLTILERYGISPVLFAFLSLLLVFFLYQIVGGIVTVLLFGIQPTEQHVFGYRLTTGIAELLLILVPTIALVHLISFAPAKFLRLRPASVQSFIFPLIGIFSLQQMLQVYLIFQDRIPLPPDVQSSMQQFKDMMDQLYKLLASSNTVPELLWVILIVAFIPAIAEEFLFRGLVQRSFEKAVSPMRAAVMTGIIFGAYHLNPFSFVPLVALGVYLGFVAYRADSLWASVATHFYNNALACISLYFSLRDDYVIIGNANEMSIGSLLFTFWLFGVVFLVSTYYFIVITRRPVLDESAANE
jgi:membrane protease YdiL (CAAX protease family)